MALSFWQKYGAQRATDKPKWGGAFLSFGCGHQDETRYDTQSYTESESESESEIVAWAQRTICKDCRATAKVAPAPLPKPGTSMTMMCRGQDSRSTTHSLCGGSVQVDSRRGAPAERCVCWCHR